MEIRYPIYAWQDFVIVNQVVNKVLSDMFRAVKSSSNDL